MDLFVVVIIAAMLITVATVFLGLLTMSGGGSTNKALGTPLMWTRVGFHCCSCSLPYDCADASHYTGALHRRLTPGAPTATSRARRPLFRDSPAGAILPSPLF